MAGKIRLLIADDEVKFVDSIADGAGTRIAYRFVVQHA